MASLKRNFAYQVLYQFLLIVLPLITSPYIARVLGPSGVGIYSYTYSISSYFALFAKLGIHVYGNRSIATVRDNQKDLNKTFSDLLFVHVGIAFFVLVVYIIYLTFIPIENKAIATVQIFYVIAELIEVNWFFFGMEQFKISVVRNSIIKLLTVIAIFLLVKNETDTFMYCAILSISAAVSELTIWIYVPKYVKIIKPDFRAAKKHIVPMISFFIPSVAVSLYKVMDKIMLGAMKDSINLGYYENSEKVTAIALTVVTALGTVMMPRMSNLASKGDKKGELRITDLSMKYICLLSLAMAFGIAGVSKVFAPVFYGDKFRECSALMAGLSISIPFTSFANVIRTQYLIPNHRDRVFQLSVICGAVVNLFNNWILIPILGAMGAVVGTVIAEISVCLIQSFFSRGQLPIASYVKKSVPFMISGLVMFICVDRFGDCFPNTVITLLLQVICGVLIYFTMIFAYWKVTNDEVLISIERYIRNIAGRISGKP